VRLADIWTLVKEAASAWIDDYAPSMGAAIAYYTMFSIAPLLLIAIAVAGLAFGQEAANGEVMAQLGGMMGQDGAKAVESMIRAANEPSKGTLATLVGAVLLIVGATTVFAELQDSLDRIWRAPARPGGSGIWGLLRARLLSFGMILGIGFLLIVSLLMSAALSAFGGWMGPIFGGWEVLAHAVNFVISFAMVSVLFAMIYKIMPRVKIAWRDVWTGAIVTALLFTIGKFAIGLYIGKSGVASAFGAAGSLAVLLIWVYYSAQIFLLGAEFTWVYAHRFGSKKSTPEPAPAVTLPSRKANAQGGDLAPPVTDAGEPSGGLPGAVPSAAAPVVPLPVSPLARKLQRDLLAVLSLGLLAGGIVGLAWRLRAAAARTTR
jgi:membrane protein